MSRRWTCRCGLLVAAAFACCLRAGAAELPEARPAAILPGLIDPTFAPTLWHGPPSTVLQRLQTIERDGVRGLRQPSVARTARLDRATRLVELDRFGRSVEAELGAALGPAEGLILDLRHNHGGSIRRMLRVAARFTGPVADALMLIGEGRVTALAIPDPAAPVWSGWLTVLVGSDTISSGEVLAGLLRRYARARVLGERTWGKDFAMRVELLDHDWQALVPAGRLEIPGEALHGGLLPDGPIPSELLVRLEPQRSRPKGRAPKDAARR